MKTVGLFYGSSTCYTEMTAEKILAQASFDVEIHNLADVAIEQCLAYDFIIFGIPTWDYGELQEDWENQWEALSGLDFSGKTVAIYGQGDQFGYPEWFLDAVGYLHDVVKLNGGRMIGYTDNMGYEFETSQALSDDETQFLGLALDDENQFEQSEERLSAWLAQIEREFNES